MNIFGSEVCSVSWDVGSGLAHVRGVTWRAAPAKFKRGMCEMKILGSEVLWCIFGTLVQDGLAQMRGVTCRAVPAKFKRGMSEFPSIYMPTRHQLKSFGRHRSWVG